MSFASLRTRLAKLEQAGPVSNPDRPPLDLFDLVPRVILFLSCPNEVPRPGLDPADLTENEARWVQPLVRASFGEAGFAYFRTHYPDWKTEIPIPTTDNP